MGASAMHNVAYLAVCFALIQLSSAWPINDHEEVSSASRQLQWKESGLDTGAICAIIFSMMTFLLIGLIIFHFLGCRKPDQEELELKESHVPRATMWPPRDPEEGGSEGIEMQVTKNPAHTAQSEASVEVKVVTSSEKIATIKKVNSGMDVFAVLDADDSHDVDVTEFGNWLGSIDGIEFAEAQRWDAFKQKEIQKHLEEIDTHHTGTISRAEFELFWLTHNPKWIKGGEYRTSTKIVHKQEMVVV